MNTMNKDDVSATEAVKKLWDCVNLISSTNLSSQALLCGSASRGIPEMPWRAQMANMMSSSRYLAIPEMPALESLAFAIEKSYSKNHHGELGLHKMLEDCFLQRNWHQTIRKRFQDFKNEHDLNCVSKDVIVTFEILLNLIISNRVQSLAICDTVDAMFALKAAIERDEEQ